MSKRSSIRLSGLVFTRCLKGVLVPFFMVSLGAMAALPPMVSQVVSVGSPLVDEFGVRLTGTDPAASAFGLPVVEGDVVHIYMATDGVIYPPDTNGVPDPRNTLLKEVRIGIGASPKEATPGRFSCILTPRPSGGVTIFVRVFNGSTTDASSFYMDSQLFTVSSVLNENFIAEFAAGIQPLDANDDDGDSINNSWEKSYGSDPGNPDTDGDHQSDAEEILAGTRVDDADSVFLIANATPIPPEQVLLSWQTQAGRTYTIEYKENLGDANPFEVVGVVKGDGSVAERLVPADTASTGLYRIHVGTTPAAE